MKDAGIDDSLDPFGDVAFRWEYFAEATGDVGVPPNNRVGLWVHRAALNDLSPLSELRPDDLYMLMVNPLPTPRLNPDEAIMPYLRNLSGLRTLVLKYMNITHKGMQFMKGLRSLRHLNLASALTGKRGAELWDFGDPEGIACLAELQSLETLWLSIPRITDDSLSYLTTPQSLEELRVRGEGITDAGMSHIAKLTNLRALSTTCPITNGGLATLTALKSLTRLRLQRTAITMSGLAQLNALTGLTHLELYNVPSDGSSLDIGRLTQLRLLDFGKTRLGDEDLACLAKLIRLRELYLLPQSGISDRGIAHLSGLVSLEHLGIGGPHLTDESLSYLANMKKLDYLWIGDGDFTDEGLRPLEGLKGLRTLNITSEGAFSKEALERLRRSLPNVQTFTVVP